jgi:rhodanese-related sulfurtransferase
MLAEAPQDLVGAVDALTQRRGCIRLCVRYNGRMIQQLTPQKAHELISQGDVEIIDVRNAVELSDGRLPGARHVPLDQLRASPKAMLLRDRVIFVCAAGVRSQAAAKIAEASGLREVYNLSGGARGWARAGLPLVRDLTAA